MRIRHSFLVLTITLGVLACAAVSAEQPSAPALSTVPAGTPRWLAAPVCPLVSGLTQQDGEFVLERLSEIARVAGIGLADENCHPNLYVFVTPDPRQLLRTMQQRNRDFTFGAAALPGAVDEFIDTALPVRVWYNADIWTAWGQPPDDGRPHSVNDYPLIRGQSSRLESNVVYTLYRVFVIVDRTRLKGVTRGQLADYIAMVGLAKLTLAERPDKDTILKLFETGPRAAPASMTDRDQQVLKSLYRKDGFR
ncbi:MAG TPA: hypothetical protein VME21_02995 [Steroidobacteraceae bacterium]|nr:hypothetical protein [Steroidobacteraceae bacterium]